MIEAGSLWQLIERRAQATPDALFAVDENDRELSFAEYRSRAERCAAGLARSGVVGGTRVSWQLPTTLESMLLAAALARLGAVQNPILPIYREREVGFAVRQCEARILAVPSRFRRFDYTAMAGAIEHLTRALAVDLAPLRVNAVCAGYVLTEVWDRIPEDQREAQLRRMTERQPLPRAGDPAELAEAYLYLMRGTFSTGQVLIVDGGMSLV